MLSRVHRQAGTTRSSIWRMHWRIRSAVRGIRAHDRRRARDDRVVLAERVEADPDGAQPGAGLAQRDAHPADPGLSRPRMARPSDALLAGEPLICDGIELPLKHRKKRIDLEARGLIKGAQVVYLGPGRKPGFSRLHVFGAEDPQVSAASIIKIEAPGRGRAVHPLCRPHGGRVSARGGGDDPQGAGIAMGHGAGLRARPLGRRAAGRIEAGSALWKRLAYVAITRAESGCSGWALRLCAATEGS